MRAWPTLDFVRRHPLTRRNQFRAYGRILAWQIRSRLRAEVIVPFVDSTKLAARRHMHGATGNIYVGMHEFEDMAFVLHMLHPGDIFVDVGANIGSYTVLASGVRGARTIAFEPDRENVRRLRRNVEINGIGSLVEVHEAAAGERRGRVRFSQGLDSTNHVLADAGSGGVEIEMDTLDSVLDRRHATLLKIDAEGYDAEVIKGAKATLERPSLKALIVENSDAAKAHLVQLGFRRCSYDPFTRELTDLSIESRSQGLFIRDIAAMRQKVTTAPRFEVLNQMI